MVINDIPVLDLQPTKDVVELFDGAVQRLARREMKLPDAVCTVLTHLNCGLRQRRGVITDEEMSALKKLHVHVTDTSLR